MTDFPEVTDLGGLTDETLAVLRRRALEQYPAAPRLCGWVDDTVHAEETRRLGREASAPPSAPELQDLTVEELAQHAAVAEGLVQLLLEKEPAAGALALRLALVAVESAALADLKTAAAVMSARPGLG